MLETLSNDIFNQKQQHSYRQSTSTFNFIQLQQIHRVLHSQFISSSNYNQSTEYYTASLYLHPTTTDTPSITQPVYSLLSQCALLLLLLLLRAKLFHHFWDISSAISVGFFCFFSGSLTPVWACGSQPNVTEGQQTCTCILNIFLSFFLFLYFFFFFSFCALHQYFPSFCVSFFFSFFFFFFFFPFFFSSAFEWLLLGFVSRCRSEANKRLIEERKLVIVVWFTLRCCFVNQLVTCYFFQHDF